MIRNDIRKYNNDGEVNMKVNKIIQGDCVEVMKTFPDNYVTTIITDPPYGLAFMGKEWDDFGTDLKKFQEWARIWAVEAFRVAKPGATLLCFGGIRTFHRLTCGLEDAGWQIKDVLMWLYGSGFPKSLNIGKAVDKLQGNNREILATIPDRWTGKGNTYQYSLQKERDTKVNITKGNTQWEGYGTALKPAYEPIIMAIKPNEGSYANNALKWGVAGLNIDGCRIVTNEQLGRQASSTTLFGQGKMTSADFIDNSNKAGGRFPANVILDEESAELLNQQSGISKSGNFSKGSIRHYSIWNSTKGQGIKCNAPDNYGDKGGASRFFYCAKASKSERTVNGQAENNHPTVKPLELIKYLVKLATPQMV
jgi:site-specific DNA-methyltransferase (adenine-specific)